MPIITLTSDLGLTDYYAGAVKGALLQLCPNAQLVDISHLIARSDLQHTSFVIRNSWRHFPEGTVHWIGVSGPGKGIIRKLIALHENHWFVARDEGLFSLIFGTYPERLFTLREDLQENCPVCSHSMLVLAAGHLASGGDVADISTEVRHMETLGMLQAQESSQSIKGAIINVDIFGNLTVNIGRKQFQSLADGRSFELHFRGEERITKLSHRYSDVPSGEKLCRFNSSGHLEIAINQGNASALLGLRTEDSVQLTFN